VTVTPAGPVRAAAADETDFRAESPFIRRAARAAPRLRLFCLPHAGAGASAFADWPGGLRPDIEVLAIQPPGREDRLDDPPITGVGVLVRAVVQAMRPYLDLPSALFGHSGGGALAFEVAAALRARSGTELTRLFISGWPAPGTPPRRPLHALSDDELARVLAELGGTRAELLADPGARSFVLPPVRADFTMWETHVLAPAAPLSSPITVFAGELDPLVSRADLDGWSRHTTAGFRRHEFPGGHFFPQTHRVALLAQIERDLTGY
jgi:medium-chain acyl-[acyl-carrier-protein] hydrolase